jgi:hypothetical protein
MSVKYERSLHSFKERIRNGARESAGRPAAQAQQFVVPFSTSSIIKSKTAWQAGVPI